VLSIRRRIENARRRAHRPRAGQPIERKIALEMVEGEPPQIFQAKRGIPADECMRRVVCACKRGRACEP
jgi:hypothetical protein